MSNEGIKSSYLHQESAEDRPAETPAMPESLINFSLE